MKKLNLLLLAFLVVMGVTLQSCDDSDGYSLGDVAVDWATVNVKGAHVYDFTGDRWGQIWPATTDYFWYSPIDGQRVILYFNPLYDNYPEGYDCSVKVLNIKEILTKPIGVPRLHTPGLAQKQWMTPSKPSRLSFVLTCYYI